ncbi:hypothetical protein MPSEU_000761400 [Mayamaea pseudoterrestris]|nr:hypothetical protein MPSEU_000761400 [Mayamaea pseudoterrestris]
MERFLHSLPEVGRVNVIVGLKQDQDEHALDNLKRSLPDATAPATKQERGKGLKRVNAASATLTKRQIKKLLRRNDIDYIEQDFDVFLDSSSTVNSEIVPYGVSLSQGSDSGASNYQAYSSRTYGACNDPNSIKIAIIDSGADVNHPDLPCRDINADDTNCIGSEFGVDGETWSTPRNPHGTHVFGIVAARRNNELGIVGMTENVCYMFAQIFGEDGSSKNSAVIDAVDWAVENGATVINMSLGSSTRSRTAEQYFAVIRKQGILVVSAAGNDGNSDYHYPASYDSVISVASVDANLQRSEFSQYNSMVDIAAPGSAILSTFAGNATNAAVLIGPKGAYTAATMVGTIQPDSEGMAGQLVFCSDFGKNVCEGSGGHICVIQRGETSFEVKAANCEASGGVAAIIYNNLPNTILVGAISESSGVNIPVIGMTAEDATSLYMGSYGNLVSIQAMTGYAIMDGTSMSTPFVTGAIAEIWRHCPRCSADAVESCLMAEALPLNDSDTDYGFLQTKNAFSCLASRQCCSGAYQSAAPTMAPTVIDQ